MNTEQIIIEWSELQRIADKLQEALEVVRSINRK